MILNQNWLELQVTATYFYNLESQGNLLIFVPTLQAFQLSHNSCLKFDNFLALNFRQNLDTNYLCNHNNNSKNTLDYHPDHPYTNPVNNPNYPYPDNHLDNPGHNSNISIDLTSRIAKV